MLALRFERFGPPDVLEAVDWPMPVAEPGWALVRVAAASVNPSDVKNVEGAMEGTVLPRVPGRDFAGTVAEGPAEWVGAEVWGTGGDMGFTRDGSHAEAILLPTDALMRKPRNLSFDQAASIGVTFVVAWLGAVEYGKLQGGETVAVIGVGGGVGGAVAQIAKGLGARVIGLDRQPPPAGAPASSVLDAFIGTGETAAEQVRHVTDGRGASLVFDAVGGVMFETALRLAAPHGRVIEISAAGKRRVEFDLIEFYHNETRLIGADSRKLDTVASARLMAELVPGFENGLYKPQLIAERYPLSAARDAYRAVARGIAGRVVLIP
jgi:NADPH:quinone reductase